MILIQKFRCRSCKITEPRKKQDRLWIPLKKKVQHIKENGQRKKKKRMKLPHKKREKGKTTKGWSNLRIIAPNNKLNRRRITEKCFPASCFRCSIPPPSKYSPGVGVSFRPPELASRGRSSNFLGEQSTSFLRIQKPWIKPIDLRVGLVRLG